MKKSTEEKKSMAETKLEDVCNNSVVIIDSFNLFFRFYHSHPSMTTANGMPVGGLYGYCRLLVQLITKSNPTIVVAALDSGSDQGIRRQIFAPYKMNRESPNEDIIFQLSQLPRIHEAFDIFDAKKTGYEADDIIAATTKFYNTKKKIILSSDKDLTQLVNENTAVFDPFKSQLLDSDGVFKKFGVTPEQITLFIALIGDASDNFPGIPGIGPKTASILLSEFPTKDKIYAAIANGDKSIKPRIADLLKAHEDELEKYILLAKLYPECCDTFPTEEKKLAISSKTINLLNEFEFNAILRNIGKVKTEAEHFEIDEVEKENLKEATEVSLLFQDDIVVATILLRNEPKKIFLATEEAQTLLKNPTIKKMILNQPTTAVSVIGATNYHFVNLMNYAISTSSKNDKEAVQSPIPNFDIRIKELRTAECLDIYSVDNKLQAVVEEMTNAGVKIDKEKLSFTDEKFKKFSQSIEGAIYHEAGEVFNIGSTKQLNRILFERLGVLKSKIKTKSGLQPTDHAALTKWASQGFFLAHLILQWRHYQKLITTYSSGLLKFISTENKFHSEFSLNSTSTGRLTSNSPNLQNIPIKTEDGREIRSAFVSSFKDGNLISCDYSQIEMHVLAELADVKNLKKILNVDGDIHTITAQQIFEKEQISSDERGVAKMINFGIIYGISPHGLASRLKIPIQKASDFIEKYMLQHPEIAVYMNKVWTFAGQNGFVPTLFGRRCSISINAKMATKINSVSSPVYRAAINAPIQGTAADIMRRAMILVRNKIKKKEMQTKLILQVHDELILDSPKHETEDAKILLQQEMNKAGLPFIKLKSVASSAENWGDC